MKASRFLSRNLCYVMILLSVLAIVSLSLQDVGVS
jgi:hypothetical protein